MKQFQRKSFWFLWEYTQRFIAFILLFPSLLLVLPFGLIILSGSPGSFLVKQIREGKNGTLFKIFKLRTMVADAEEYLQDYLKENAAANLEWINYGRLSDDPRIAGRAARFARRFSIDELPQLLNVVSGKMNLVGPRPLPPKIADQIILSDLEVRRMVLPGMTGLWQISGRSDLPISVIGKLDSLYVEKQSFLYDVGILFRTAGAVLSGKGAY